jgi:AIPR protein
MDTYFGREIELQIDFIADKPGKKGPPPAQSYEITLSQHLETVHDGIKMYLGFVPLNELHMIYVSLRELFFDRNIRGALSDDNPPNKKIREALENIVLKGTDEASVFAFRHNGVTLAAEKATLLDGHIRLHVPRVLNGAQTISSVGRFLESRGDNPLLKQNRDKLEAVQVIAKIIVDVPTSDFVTQVTISNNRQNRVDPWALRAMEMRQVDLADKLRGERGIFYSRQEGVFENLTDEEREEMGIEESRAIHIRPLAQTFLAVQGDIYNMGHLPDVFESRGLYEKTFKSSYQMVDSRAIVLAYKVGLMIQSAMLHLRDIVPTRYQIAVPKARNLTWALLIQALLNDRKYKQYLEDYGQSLVRDAPLREILKTLVGSRIWPILKELLNSSSYHNKVVQEKYDFLRTAEVFKKAMDIAADKFKWNKQAF